MMRQFYREKIIKGTRVKSTTGIETCMIEIDDPNSN